MDYKTVTIPIFYGSFEESPVDDCKEINDLVKKGYEVIEQKVIGMPGVEHTYYSLRKPD